MVHTKEICQQHIVIKISSIFNVICILLDWSQL